MLCKYRHIFGIEKESIHSIRLLNIAVVDMLLTMIAAFVFALYIRVSFLLVFLILMIIATIIHRLFCVNTTITMLVFGFIDGQSKRS
jgi:hypothetical protein